MKRKVLLLEPNYKNKYPPMGLMKLATYFRRRGDDVRFFKGNLRDLAVELLFEQHWSKSRYPHFGEYANQLRQYIRTGKLAYIEKISDTDLAEEFQNARKRFKNENFPQFDIICVTTLFTFYWKETIETIEYAKKFTPTIDRILVGGIASTILHKEFENATGIKPYRNDRGGALLDRPGQIDPDSDVIIDELPLDYSILDEIDYKYPAQDAYFAYMTRGCVNHCSFCAVPRLEPKAYCKFKSIKKQIEASASRFGEQRNLLLLDNNVFASRAFEEIIDEIKELGFKKGDLFFPPNPYSFAIKNIRDDYNARTYIKIIVSIYDQVAILLPEKEQGEFYIEREKLFLLYADTATSEAILNFDEKFSPLYEKYINSKNKTSRGRARYVDFNQGLDATLATEQKMKKLSEINIFPLRIAFDHWDEDPQRPHLGPMRDIYTSAVRMAAKYGIKNLSNYLLYNTNDDTPQDLYNRLRLNVDLSDQLDINIYSFPMKYHPIDDPQYFKNRDFIGTSWSRKSLRAIQAVLNSTHGKIGRGKNFFEAAFGSDLEKFNEILLMPEAFIVERYKYDSEAYDKYLSYGGKENPILTQDVRLKYGNLTATWRNIYYNFSEEEKKKIIPVICKNKFTDDIIKSVDEEFYEFIKFYQIQRNGT